MAYKSFTANDTGGQLVEENEAGTTLNIPTAETYVPWASAEAVAPGQTGSIGLITPTVGAGTKFTVDAGGAGRYLISYSSSFEPEGNAEVHMCLLVNDVCVPVSVTESESAVVSKIALSLSITVMILLAEGDTVKLGFTSNTNGDDIDLYHTQLTMARVFK